jgi:tetratricopeptide (TPR) repeat protein
VRQARRTLSVPALPGSYNSSEGILTLASDVLGASLERARGQRSAQIALLRDALTRQDGFLYIEPPDWYAPVRESLGAALFAAGNYRMAAQVFADDLRRNPRNPRSLFGQAEAFGALGEAAAASRARRAFNAAWKTADTSLTMRDL